MKIIGTFLIVLLAWLVGTLLCVYVLSTLWGWFVVPLGAPSINWAAAYGIVVIVALFKTHELKPVETLKAALVADVGRWLGWLVLLGVGRIALVFAEWGGR